MLRPQEHYVVGGMCVCLFHNQFSMHTHISSLKLFPLLHIKLYIPRKKQIGFIDSMASGTEGKHLTEPGNS